MGRLDGKVAVITGGASGMGEATVRRFVDEGGRVVVADVQDAKGHTIADTLAGAAVYQHTDVADDADVRADVRRAIDEFGAIDIMFNNAGIGGAVGPIDEIEVEEYDRTMNVLLRGVFLGMKHAAGPMRAQRSGSIISTASVAGLGGGRGPHIYSAAKAAIINLTRSVAIELGEHMVRVNCICPGGIATPLLAGGLGAPEALDMVRAALAGLQPTPRAGMPDDIASAALWLASDEASFVTGHALVVDGGLTAGTKWSLQPETLRVHREMSW